MKIYTIILISLVFLGAVSCSAGTYINNDRYGSTTRYAPYYGYSDAYWSNPTYTLPLPGHGLGRR